MGSFNTSLSSFETLKNSSDLWPYHSEDHPHKVKVTAIVANKPF